MARVLIVEDEDSLRETLSRFLAREGHQVQAASNGREAFDGGLQNCPDVLVADWMLKNHIHGLHVSEAFRAVNPRLHTILITGFPSQDLLAESDRCGVLQLLEKPFDLMALQRAVNDAVGTAPVPSARNRPLAVLDVARDGAIRFASERAREIFEITLAGADAKHSNEILGTDAAERLREAEVDWITVKPPTEKGDDRWLLRTRARDDGDGWLAVLYREDEQQRTSDARVRILLDHRSHSAQILPDKGPVVVIERDGAVRRLLVSQIERIGALCYPTDELETALRLLSAEPRARTVLIDFALVGDAMSDWVSRLEAARPGLTVIGTGGAGAEEDLLAQGVSRVLRKPWRIMDLLDAISD